MSRVKTIYEHGRVDIIAVEAIAKGEIIACIPFVLVPKETADVTYKDSSAVNHVLTHDQMNSFNEDYSLFEFDLLYARYACFYSANSVTSYKIINNQKLVLVTTALQDIQQGDFITLDLGAYFYDPLPQPLQCSCGHKLCPKLSYGFKRYPHGYKEALIQKKYIDIACAAEYYADQWRSKTARALIDQHYLTQLEPNELEAFYYFYDQTFLYP